MCTKVLIMMCSEKSLQGRQSRGDFCPICHILLYHFIRNAFIYFCTIYVLVLCINYANKH